MSGILLAHRHAGVKTGIVLPAVGDPFMDGYYAGIIDTTKGNIIAADSSQSGARFALIVSDISLETTRAFKTTDTAVVYRSDWDGLSASLAMNADAASYPAAEYCIGLAHPADAASQWYLPSRGELILLYNAFKPTTNSNSTGSRTGVTFPSSSVAHGDDPYADPPLAPYTSSIPTQTSVAIFQSGGAQAFSSTYYVTATESTTTNRWNVNFTSGGVFDNAKSFATYRVRPVRRLVLA